MRSKYFNPILILLLMAVCYFPLCHRIDSYCIQMWDESRNVINAIEMLRNHNFITRYFENNPDMWELKPPFLIWLQVLSFKVFGLNEISVRLPSMLASMLTVVFMLWFSFKVSGNILPGILSALILVSSMGYIGEHAARFGDHDSLLSLFSICTLVYFYLFVSKNQKKYLGLGMLCFFLGWFTKSIIIFMFLPGLLLWLLLSKNAGKIFRDKLFWTYTSFILILMAIYYVLREAGSPGYLQQVWMNEWFGRYFDLSENYHYHHNGFWYYWNGFINGRFEPYIYLLLFIVPLVSFIKKAENKTMVWYFSINAIVFFLVLSAGTKNFWYEVPLYPLMSLCIGYSVYAIFKLLNAYTFKGILIGTFLFMIFENYTKVYAFTTDPDPNRSHPIQSICYFLKNQKDALPKELKIVEEDYRTSIYFYIEKWQGRGNIVGFVNKDHLKKNELYLISNFTLDRLNLRPTEYKVLKNHDNASIIQLDVIDK
ncbi:MAG: glycosyltransferase family 39 protein [Flavobacteriales bacterium]|nr:glycosyltransferase family 39 protein [Flavobacteriales bacterium]